ncbi:MAG: polyribonucleotide nucleotidyltransferase [Vallitaleaceae bacterium]|jgi:polyribonucleotide nucleotidyltransferase|nr:polyribonucleotide nucleotidyltransferase [Vallitaleaceae bacterium]
MSRVYSTTIAGRTLSIEVGKVAEQASGAVIVSYGDTVVLSTATASQKPREGIDFFPLSVDYEEKFYSVGKIPGGFIKREGRPSENAVLTGRVIDRPMRPLFPKDYRNDCAIVNMVVSVDQDCSPEFCALVGSSISVSISDIPFFGPLSTCFVGLIDGQYIINPDADQRKISEMMVTVSSTDKKVMMIEATANEVDDDVMIKGIFKGHEANQEIIKFFKEIIEKEGKPKHSYTEVVVPADIFSKMVEIIPNERMEAAVFTDVKDERTGALSIIKDELVAAFTDIDETWLSFIDEAMYLYQKKTVRKMILKDQKRPDGRAMDEIRKLSAEIDVLPRTHGTGLFQRGQTQVLTVTTLGALSEKQRVDGLDADLKDKRYMHHYNFPSYSVGETRPSRGPGRREIGHGALAENAIIPVLPSEDDFPYAIRTVSEILSSNGSTSQGSICASTLSLMAAGVPIKAAVAGISCGLVTGENEDEFVLLTDIQGLEDFFGDMDFKVAGTHKGITAIQLDMKLQGISHEVIEQSIYNTKKARLFILDEVMLKAIPEARKELSEYAPKIIQTTIDPEKISEVIGARGKVINKIIEETGVKIDIDDTGRVFVCSENLEKANEAIAIIQTIAKGVEVGAVYTGKVVRVTNFGAFVELVPGKDGLVHISKLAKERVNKVEDIVNVGDMVKVKVMEVDQQGRINLSMKDLLE